MIRALQNLRVLDLSRMLPGPYCSMMLADLGAEVIKIEEPAVGDPTRLSPPIHGNQGGAFRQVNRNKKSIAVDLKHPEGRDIFLRLARTADVILEQFRPGVVDRLGIDYQAVSRLNPQLVYCSLTGFGQNGPHRERSGHDLNYLALAGVLGLTTDRAGVPVIPGVQIADITGGFVAGFAILAALIARERTGRGQFVDVSMFDVLMSMLPVPASQHFAGIQLGVGDKYGLSGAHPFYNVYETRDGRFMTLGALEPKFWVNFCRRVGRDDLIERQFDEGERRDALFNELRSIFLSRSQTEWIQLMRDADCCCEPVLSVTEAFDHSQAVAREMIQKFEPGDRTSTQLGFSYKLSDTPAQMTCHSPELGEHTSEVLIQLGLSESERQRLIEMKVIRCAGSNFPGS